MDLTHEANVPQSGLEDQGRFEAAKQKLGQLGRKLKRIDVRESIVDHPFAAIGIAAAVGALIAFARPMPKRGRVASAVVAGLSAIGIRLLREAALRQFGDIAKSWLQNQQGAPEADYPPTYADPY